MLRNIHAAKQGKMVPEANGTAPEPLRSFPTVSHPLPKGWHRARLDDITVRASGHTPDQSRPEYWDGGIKWVSLADSAELDRGYIAETAKEISTLGIQNSSALLLPPETVIVSRDAGVGKSAVLAQEMAVSQHFIAWDCNSQNVLDPWFLYAWLQTQKPFFERMAVGSTIKTIGLPLFKKLTIDFPPLSEQRKIAEILRTWDEAIEKLGDLRAAKERRLDGLRTGLLFGSLRPDGRRSNWQPRRLSEVTFELSERNGDLTLGREAVMGVTNSRGIVPMREQTVAEDISRYKRLPPRAFAYNPMRINVGSIAMNEGKTDILVSPDYVAFDCKPGGLEPDYLDHLRKTVWWTHHISSGGSGSVRQRTYYDDLAALHLPLPDVEEQCRFVRVLNAARDDLITTDQMIESMTRQKRGLMQKLLTGEWRVKAAAKEAAA
jgi:type I restriction enzyme, S subunit